MASDLSAIIYEPVIWYRCIRVPEGVKMVSSLSATIYEPAGVRVDREPSQWPATYQQVSVFPLCIRIDASVFLKV